MAREGHAGTEDGGRVKSTLARSTAFRPAVDKAKSRMWWSLSYPSRRVMTRAWDVLAEGERKKRMLTRRLLTTFKCKI